MRSPDAAAATRIAASETPATARAQRIIPSSALFVDRQEIVIVHAGSEYRLRITRAGKLILTK